MLLQPIAILILTQGRMLLIEIIVKEGKEEVHKNIKRICRIDIG